MRILLDTHLILWWQSGDPRLPETVRGWVMEQAEAVFVSLASVWEMAIKFALNRPGFGGGSNL